ncbi:DUF3597 domain-containing protein [Gimesia aquarii]|uniref:Uncharacterized protein n=1 Tax=Gimesia aquarii TaxID=2527964 RepID=A0A517WWK0_9PLAN|nr:DUF3597 domain-containing protein [Gimesia aquarii]QDU09650.1 hypothetical protein V202x_30260 [Gimesia aquarii]
MANKSIRNVLLVAVSTFWLIGSSERCTAKPPEPVSVVDYMNSIGLDSSFNNRKALYLKQWPQDFYSGTAEQNIKLLKYLLGQKEYVLIPFPSAAIDGCEKFYSHLIVSKFVTEAFQKNAISACIVTGTKTPQNKIRIKLQEEYLSRKPADGKVFTAEEHKAIHDAAYKAAGCKEDSADLWGWYVVDKQRLPPLIVKQAIEIFGECTITK